MKTKIFIMMLVTLFFCCFQKTYAIKIKYRGSGGISVNGDHYDICPDEGTTLCAVVEGNLWDLLDHWFNAPTWDDVTPGSSGMNSSQQLASGITLTAPGPNGTTTVYTNVVLKFQSGVTMKKTDQTTCETSDCSKISMKILQ